MRRCRRPRAIQSVEELRFWSALICLSTTLPAAAKSGLACPSKTSATLNINAFAFFTYLNVSASFGAADMPALLAVAALARAYGE